MPKEAETMSGRLRARATDPGHAQRKVRSVRTSGKRPSQQPIYALLTGCWTKGRCCRPMQSLCLCWIPRPPALSTADSPVTKALEEGLYAHMSCCARFTENRLEAAVAKGVACYVIIGAGLDSFALRQPSRAGGLKIVEVDHPATQSRSPQESRVFCHRKALWKGDTYGMA